jgi:hypothetical protein
MQVQYQPCRNLEHSQSVDVNNQNVEDSYEETVNE